jgi:hypothetical protein
MQNSSGVWEIEEQSKKLLKGKRKKMSEHKRRKLTNLKAYVALIILSGQMDGWMDGWMQRYQKPRRYYELLPLN